MARRGVRKCRSRRSAGARLEARCSLLAALLLPHAGLACHGLLLEERANLSPQTTLANSQPDAASAGVSLQVGAGYLQRLNRSEYNNTVHDLLGTQLSPADAFPADAIAEGFDNNAQALTLSSAGLLAYQGAGEALAQEATGDDAHLQVVAPCDSSAAEADCLASFVKNFGRRVWRRPLADDEAEKLIAQAQAGGSTYAAQVEAGLEVMLLSPNFLFRVELAPAGQNGAQAPHLLGAYELATRLSYFIWSSTPDEKLLAAAADGSIVTGAGLMAHTDRLLADPRAMALTHNFAGQWLGLRSTLGYTPDPATFPNFTPSLKAAMIAQSDQVFADLLAGKVALNDLFTGLGSYLNDDLARLYGLPLPGHSDMTPVTLPAGPRRGLLGQAGVLAATSFPTRTSLVHRGRFVMTQLLCAPVPEPPANVTALVSSAEGGSQRQRLEAHVKDAACAGCHNAMDPYGFVLEQFDAVGALRTTDNGVTIDTTATLSSGEHLGGVEDLDNLLAHDVRVPSCFVQQMWTYAMGRGPDTPDQAGVKQLTDSFVAAGQRVDQLVHAIVASPAFRARLEGT